MNDPADAAPTLTAPHRFELRVYYEDTDLGGVVYYANYLRFIERARTELLRALGVVQSDLKETSGLMFMVRRCAIDYRGSARLDDELIVETSPIAIGGASLDLRQTVLRKADGAVLVEATVQAACVTEAGRAARMPKDLRARLMAFAETAG